MGSLKGIVLAACCAGIVAAVTACSEKKPPETVLYVSPEGNDSWSGTLPGPDSAGGDGPFATPERARDAIRAMRRDGTGAKGPVTVVIRGGFYHFTHSLVLTAEDGGNAEAPVVWRASEGETVRFAGGVPVGNFVPADGTGAGARIDPSVRRDVVTADLAAAGITDYGTIRPRGFGRPIEPAALELFFDGEPMTVARWPNGDWTTIAGVPGSQPDPTDVRRTADSGRGVYVYEGDRPKTWAQDGDIWIHGYWTWDWADSYEHVKSVDTRRRVIETYEPHGVYGYKAGQRFYYLNVPEELDVPGEWYLDRTAGMLYFLPPSPADDGEAIVSLLDEPVIVLDGASYVTVRGFAVECTRGNGVEIRGGSGNLVAGCLFRNIGNVAVIVEGGDNNGVRGCDIVNTGDGGIRLSGGDRNTLVPAGNFAENNHIRLYSRWSRTYRPAVMVGGVGNRASHNHIHDAPHMGIGFGGNDHVLEYNEVHDICRETGDVGAFCIGRDWTMRGNIVRYNYFHDIEGPYTHGAMSVYLDDAASGTLIYGNVFHHASRAAFIGGGRDNTVENNIFVDCYPSVHVDGRGIGWASSHIAPGGAWNMYDKLDAVKFREPPYSTRYPQLVSLPDDEPELPKGNVVIRNISVGGRWLDLMNGVDSLGIVTIEDNLVDGDPGFVDAENGDFSLRDDSPAYELGFKPIPFGEIGLVDDEYRRSIPAIRN